MRARSHFARVKTQKAKLMFLENPNRQNERQNTAEKLKPEFPVLQKALRADFDVVKIAYSKLELQEMEEHLKTHSWVANYLPGVVAEAERRLEKRREKTE